MAYGLTLKRGTGGDRLEVQCEHQSGVLYFVPGEASWVCTPENLHAHALAGFFKELVKLNDSRVAELMQRWGLYFRERPLEREAAAAQQGVRSQG